MNKAKTLLLIMTLLGAGSYANADYKCNSVDAGQVHIKSQDTPLGDTVVVVEKDEKKSYHFGDKTEDGAYFKIVKIKFEDTEGSFSIIHFPAKQCGRLECSSSTHKLSGTLTLPEGVFDYMCYETPN